MVAAEIHVPATPVPTPVEPVRESVHVEEPAPVVVQQALSFGTVDQIPDIERQKASSRRRARESDANLASEPLVFIETAADKVQQAALTEEDAPRRSTPRPRKARPVANEPLVFVETGKSGTNPADQGTA